MKKITGFLLNGTLLSLSSMLLQMVDGAFMVYISAKIGADSVGLLGLVTSVYRFAVTLSSAGLSLAATKTIAERLALNQQKAAKKAATRSVLLGLLISLSVAIILLCFAGWIAKHLLLEALCAPSLRVLALSLPFIAVSSGISGYFTAVRSPYKGVISNVFSFIFRIALTVLLLSSFTLNIRSATLIISVCITISEIICAVIMMVFFLLDLRKLKNGISGGGVTKQIISVLTPVALSSYIRSALGTIEQLVIPPSLMKCGESQTTALGKYGMIKGMVIPVVLTPSSLLYAFSGLLVPELSRAKAKNDQKSTERITSVVFSLTLVYSIAIFGVLFFYSNELSLWLFDSVTPAPYIKTLAPLTIVMFLDGAVDNVLKGLGEQVYCMRINIIDATLSLVLIAVLVPLWGINAWIFVILITEIFNTFFSVYKLIEITSFKINLRKHLLLPLFLCIASICLSKLLLRGVFSAVLSLFTYLILCLIFITPFVDKKA